MGCKVEDFGLEENISIFLNELGIKQFYKFQEDAIQEIVFGENVVIKDSIIGPHVTIGTGTKIEKCELKNSLIQNNSVIQQLDCSNAMIGNNVHYNGNHTFVSIGDYSELK